MSKQQKIAKRFSLPHNMDLDSMQALNAGRNIRSKHLVSYKDAYKADINQPIVIAEKLITSTPALC